MLRGSKTIMKKLQWEVAPITIITIDLLENLEMSVKNFKLSDLLKDYFAYCDANFRDINDDLPLPEFIRLNYASKMAGGGSYLTKALETFEESMKIIAPMASTNR